MHPQRAVDVLLVRRVVGRLGVELMRLGQHLLRGEDKVIVGHRRIGLLEHLVGAGNGADVVDVVFDLGRDFRVAETTVVLFRRAGPRLRSLPTLWVADQI